MTNPLKIISLSAFSLLLLAACGGSTTEVTETPLPPPSSSAPVTYSGPPASTADIQQFRLALWDNISPTDRCGSCHIQGGQSPTFARNDDINLAYAEANTVVNLDNPSDSRMVTFVGEGHNCWLASNDACADIMTTWITNWAGVAQEATDIPLEAPQARQPGANKNFPADPSLFAGSVYPILTTYCADCHTNSAAIPISPFFASDDLDEAYQASRSRINLDIPADSRFVGRVRDEFHNCWTDCGANAMQLIEAIQSMSDAIPLTELDPSLVASNALTLFDGTLATGGGRFEQNVIAKWEFKTGSGNTAFDTSGVEPALDLTFSGNVGWVGGFGIQLVNGKAQGSTTNSRKIHDLITATSEFSIEAWVAPANVTQEGPARIVSYSGGPTQRNFTLGQTLYSYDALLRTSNTDANGELALTTSDADEDLQAALQHVVVNYDPINGRRIFVNGVFTDDADEIEGGLLNEWDPSYAFVLGNEVSSDIPWAGTIRLVAIHNRTLSQEQIVQNFEVGVGERFFLLFGIEAQTNIPQSYVVFEASQFDSFSYLFSEPRFVSLDSNATISSVPIQGMRIGINGREANSGQAYANIDATVSSADYQAGFGQPLSRLGTLVALEQGPQADEFFLTFERLGDFTNVVIEAEPPAPSAPVDLEPQSDIGLRNFAEINASMSALTDVPLTTPQIQDDFTTLQQQLPSVTNIDGFLSANQMAVTQLAISYCDRLVETPSIRDSYFTGFDFTRPANQAFDTNSRTLITTPILDRMIGTGVATQPDRTAVEAELNNLIDRLTTCGAGSTCDVQHTRNVAKASCAAALGSAAMLIQ
ncbi:LamG domain-containing protein [Alteromonadaceae bacterium M269]|nr:LamG domain-containing protein [Alteromonadaceae bacterium M269]